jgi:hypothetical protein
MLTNRFVLAIFLFRVSLILSPCPMGARNFRFFTLDNMRGARILLGYSDQRKAAV